MRSIYKILIYLMVVVCGGCAVTEVVIGQGSGLGLFFIIAGLSIILYIIRVPVEARNE